MDHQLATQTHLINSRIGQEPPISKRAFAVIIKPLVDLHGEPKNWEAKIGIYYDALKDIPERLLDVAVKHCIRGGDFFPKPSELRISIADELTDCYRRRREALLAALPKPPEPQPQSEEDRAHARRIVAEAKANLGERKSVFFERHQAQPVPSVGAKERELAPIVPGEVEHLMATLKRRA